MDSQPCRICIGAQGFSPSDWVGTFYPPGTSSRRFLPFYARVFDTVEMNTTFYAIPSPSTVRAWAARVPVHFTFSLKMPRAITHDKQLLEVEPELSDFLERARLLGSKLGAILVQFPASFTRRFEERLDAFLQLLPADLRFAVEFRDVSWHDEQVTALLSKFRVGWCITHWQDLPVVVRTTADFAYFRLVGFHDDFAQLGHVQRDRTQDLSALATTIHGISPNLARVYVYVNNHYAGHAPATINQLKHLLGLPRTEPRGLWPQQLGLFEERVGQLWAEHNENREHS
jgi:uncharacterized protein YecE (DUF72 family)